MRISTSALQGPQTACASLYSSPSRSAEGRRLCISTSPLQGPLRAANCASLLQPFKLRTANEEANAEGAEEKDDAEEEDNAKEKDDADED